MAEYHRSTAVPGNVCRWFAAVCELDMKLSVQFSM